MFNINILHIIKLLLPPHWRTKSQIDFLKPVAKPFITVHNVFMTFRANNLYKLSFTGQVISLEYLLNQYYQTEGIYISDTAPDYPETTIYNTEENETDEPVYVFNADETILPEEQVYLYNNEEFDLNINFIINIPIAVTFDENVVRALVNLYKLAGKQYSIKTY